SHERGVHRARCEVGGSRECCGSARVAAPQGARSSPRSLDAARDGSAAAQRQHRQGRPRCRTRRGPGRVDRGAPGHGPEVLQHRRLRPGRARDQREHGGEDGRLARRLQERPLLREAVRRDVVSARKAEIIAPVAVGDDEARWILRAKAETVRSLKAAVKAPPEPDEEEWVNLCAEVLPEKRAVIDEGLRLAGVIIGATATKMQRVNAWAEERLSTHTAPADEHADDVLFASEDEFESLKERLEQENRQWSGLEAVEPVEASQFSGETDPWRIDAELKRLVEK